MTLELSAVNNSIIFKVSDKGIGIPEEDQKHLFEAFHRAKNVGNIHGTGLGLSIVKNCIDLHEGKVECYSKEGEGTTFMVTIPRGETE